MSFDDFRLYPASRELYRGQERLRIGSRSLDILIALAERSDELVSKQELLKLIWPDRMPDDSTLRWHMAQVRRVLGEVDGGPSIVSIQGRGYRFAKAVTRSTEAVSAVTAPTETVRGAVAPVTHLVGRGEDIEGLIELFRSKRVVTITGAGGVGKTKVALAVAHRLAASYRDGADFLDLSVTGDLTARLDALTSALGPPPLADRQLLIVLDSAEHMIEALVPIVERIVAATDRVNILVTSREPLRSATEWIYRLQPLEYPLADRQLGAKEALEFPSVALFAERAKASISEFMLTDGNAPLVCAVCRRLDGIPLAIELAAGQVGIFGLQALAEELNKRFAILSHGRRTAITRHQTLQHTMDWSFDLLTPRERIVLLRLSVFRGAFTAIAASAACHCPIISEAEVAKTMAALVAKSLVSVDGTDEGIIYRLLDTTREYARQKLDSSEDAGRALRQFALHLCDRPETDRGRQGEHRDAGALRQLDDFRTALAWAASETGDRAISARLLNASAPLWCRLSQRDEFRAWLMSALIEADDAAEGLKALLALTV